MLILILLVCNKNINANSSQGSGAVWKSSTSRVDQKLQFLMLCFNWERQCGQVVWVPDLKSGGGRFKSCSGHLSCSCFQVDPTASLTPQLLQSMGIARIFQRGGGGHTESYRGYSLDCHLNIVGCLLTKRLTKGGSHAPQDPPWLCPCRACK